MTDKQRSKKSKLLAYIIIIIGLLLIFTPQFSALASIAFEIMLGWILTIGAVAQVVLLVMKKEKSDVSIWVISIALLLIGLYFLLNPASAAALMTWLVAGLAFVNGIFSLLQSFSLQGNIKTVLMLNGLIGLAFSLMIWFGWPYSGMTFIGVLLGIHLVMSGAARLVYTK